MNSYDAEEKLSKLASEVAKEFSYSGKDLNDIIKTSQQKNMLSDEEVKTLCAKANHAVYKERFAKDKLDTFKIAKFEEILTVDRHMNPVEYKVAMFMADDMIKAAGDDGHSAGTDLDDVNVNPQNAALLSEAGDRNVDDMRAIRSGRDREFDSIKNRVISLVQDGESLDSIYAVLRDSWGEENEEELKYYFTELVDELKRDGYIPKEKEFKHDFNVGEVEDTEPLKQASVNLLKLAEALIVRESAHEMIMDKLASSGYYDLAYKIENKMPGDYYGVSCALYKGADEIMKVAAGPSLVTSKQALTNALMGGAILGGGIAMLEGAYKVNDAIRKSMWKKKLRTRYPELMQIPEDRYNDLYDSIVGLEPELLRAPYALKEMIKAHDQYGTIDSNTIMNLLKSGRGRNPNSPVIAKAMSSAMTMNPAYAL